MPTLGGVLSASPSGVGDYGSIPFGSTVITSIDRTGAPYVTPIVPDETFFPDQTASAQSTLRDFTEGQDWFLKRIVGKLFVDQQQAPPGDEGATNWKNIFFAAAFFVARAHEENPNVPDLDSDEFDPIGSQNVRQPWIWRRTWMLGNNTGIDNTTESEFFFPQGNWQYGSALDGPHIDAKTARRIRREERLWFTCRSVGFINTLSDPRTVDEPVFQTFVLDYRILGAMRKSTNRSTF